jgi:lysophospholipid acyltransferase (LPLAT)-like uncharacterized protein
MLKRLLRHHAGQALLVALLGRYLAFALRTTRWTLHGAEHVAPHIAGAPAIVAFWHERLPLLPALLRVAQRETAGTRVCVLVSRHTDGRLIGELVRRFGMEVAHGSTAHGGQERGGAAGLRHLLQRLQTGSHVAITPDGPRGPRRQAAPGVAQLAALSGVPVLPCSAQASRRWTLRSWDHMVVPLPFGRGVLVCLPDIAVPNDGAAAAQPAITAALSAAADLADQLCR